MGIVLMVIGACMALAGAIPTINAFKFAAWDLAPLWSDRLAIGGGLIVGGLVIFALGAIVWRLGRINQSLKVGK